MKIQVPQFENNKRLEKRKSINVNFPVCIKQTKLSDKDTIFLNFLSENRQISMKVKIGSIERIDISVFEIDKTHDLGAIYQATGFDNKENKKVEIEYFKRLLEMEKCKITELINTL